MFLYFCIYSTSLKGHSPRVRNISTSKIPRLASDLKNVRSEIEKIYQLMVKTQSDLVAEVPSVSNPYIDDQISSSGLMHCQLDCI